MRYKEIIETMDNATQTSLHAERGPITRDEERERQVRNAEIWKSFQKEKDEQLKKVGFVQMPKDYNSKPVPNIIYHGTTRRNLHSIMKDGLKPKLNKWKYYNRWQGQHPSQKSTYDPPTPEEKKQDTAISATSELETALGYANQGGSVGYSSDQSKKDAVVLAWKPLTTDKIGNESGPDGELVFYSVIAPNRLKIVYPERLVGKEQEFLSKGATLTDFNTIKSNKMKEINQQLKKAGSPNRIKSYRYSSPKWDVFAVDTSNNDRRPEDWPGDIISPTIELNSQEFDNWLKNQF